MLVSKKRRETLKNCFQTEQTDGGRRIFVRSVALLPSKAGAAIPIFLKYYNIAFTFITQFKWSKNIRRLNKVAFILLNLAINTCSLTNTRLHGWSGCPRTDRTPSIVRFCYSRFCRVPFVLFRTSPSEQLKKKSRKLGWDFSTPKRQNLESQE